MDLAGAVGSVNPIAITKLCYYLTEYTYKILNAGEECSVFIATVQIVRNDLNEAHRLLNIPSIQDKLISTPDKLEWTKEAVLSTKSAIEGVGKVVEQARIDKETKGSARLTSRVKWVVDGHDQALSRNTLLLACHQQLSNVLGYLAPLEEPVVSEDPPAFEHVIAFSDIIAPRQERKSMLQRAAIVGSGVVIETGTSHHKLFLFCRGN